MLHTLLKMVEKLNAISDVFYRIQFYNDDTAAIYCNGKKTTNRENLEKCYNILQESYNLKKVKIVLQALNNLARERYQAYNVYKRGNSYFLTVTNKGVIYSTKNVEQIYNIIMHTMFNY